MDSLPSELLSSIHLTLLPIPPCINLMWYEEYPYPMRIKALTHLRLVSRRWNDIVLDTPQLWSYIDMDSAVPRIDIARLSLERTRGAPLHIRIHYGHRMFDEEGPFVQMFERVCSETHCWETFACNGIAFFPCHLFPPGPLPRLRQVFIGGRQDTSREEIQTPRLETLWELIDLLKIETSGAAALKNRAVPHPSDRKEWERFVKVVRNCHQLEWLRFFFHPYKPDETLRTLEDWRLPEASGGILFPSLKQFEFTLYPLPVNFLGYIHAPNLQRLIVRRPRLEHLPEAFSITTRLFESSPKLDSIRFEEGVPPELIQQCLAAVPHDRIAGMEVEVEVEYEQSFYPDPEDLTPEVRSVSTYE
ncbi:hypothetical protein FRC04_002096 [Tulasnella sp. 424]|nr:hypothetical protein FRC04_002096 [Tulasnella sp. 424]KAG8967990.1 hypothetical protein FRC05_001700 [Tulasnella sp. 425]